MKYVRLIDQNGLFIEDDFVEELTPLTIETVCPEGFILPKWDFANEVWTEGGVVPVPIAPEQTTEERLVIVETTQSQVIDVLAEIMGVTV